MAGVVLNVHVKLKGGLARHKVQLSGTNYSKVCKGLAICFPNDRYLIG